MTWRPRNRRSPPRGNPQAASDTLVQFFLNLVQTGLYKPMQGWYARLYTALGLGLIAAAGVYRVYGAVEDNTPAWRLGIPGGDRPGARLGHLPGGPVPSLRRVPVATEAEMNKVSSTSKEDLYRSTMVVLTTVLLMAVFLFVSTGSGFSSSAIIGVLMFTGGGGFGSTA